MDFQTAIQTCFSKYADFKGRAARPEFWWFALFVLLCSAATAVVSTKLYALFQIAMLVPMLAVGARRLHDTGLSGWWQLLMLVPYLGGLVLLVLYAQGTKPDTLALPGPGAQP